MSSRMVPTPDSVSGHIKNTSAAWAATSRASSDRPPKYSGGQPPRTGRRRGGSRVMFMNSPWKSTGLPSSRSRSMCMNSRVRRYLGADSRLWPGSPEEMMLIVRRPEHLIDRGELPGELRGPHLTHPHGDQELHPAQQRGDPGGERYRVDPHRVAGGQQQVVVSGLLRAERDIAAVFPARLQPAVRHAEKLVVVVTQRGKPGDLTAHGSKYAGLSPAVSVWTSPSAR